MADKLQSIMIDKANFEKLDIATVIEFLHQKSKELDPQHEGISFILRLPSETTPSPGGTAVSGGEGAQRSIRRKVSLTMSDVPLSVLVGYVAQQANLQYTFEDAAVCLHPSTDKENVSPEAAPSSGGPGSAAIQHKLESIMLSLNFSSATIEEGINFLSIESKRLDLEHKRINFVIQPEASETAKPVTMTLDNVSLGEALRQLCLEANVKYDVQDYAILIVPQ